MDFFIYGKPETQFKRFGINGKVVAKPRTFYLQKGVNQDHEIILSRSLQAESPSAIGEMDFFIYGKPETQFKRFGINGKVVAKPRTFYLQKGVNQDH